MPITDTIMAFHLEVGDHIKVGEYTYLIKSEPKDLDDGLLFETIEQNDEVFTELWFAPFDLITVILAFDN